MKKIILILAVLCLATTTSGYAADSSMDEGTYDSDHMYMGEDDYSGDYEQDQELLGDDEGYDDGHEYVDEHEQDVDHMNH